jgi:chromosome segregation and condensation protein ScpB
VSREVISGVLNGRRVPSVRSYERLRRSLGLLPSAARLTRPAPPADLYEEHISRLAACVVVSRSLLLADLSDATGVAIAAVRESLPKVQDRLIPVGLRLVTDGDQVTVMPQAHCAGALERLGQVTVDRELTQEALEALGAVALHTEATREQVEVARGGVDCASLLHRLAERGYLQATFAESGRGRPLTYRLTTKAISVLGYSSLEEVQQLFATLRAGAASSAVERNAAPGEHNGEALERVGTRARPRTPERVASRKVDPETTFAERSERLRIQLAGATQQAPNGNRPRNLGRGPAGGFESGV